MIYFPFFFGLFNCSLYILTIVMWYIRGSTSDIRIQNAWWTSRYCSVTNFLLGTKNWGWSVGTWWKIYPFRVSGKTLFTGTVKTEANRQYEVPGWIKEGDTYTPFSFFDRSAYLASKLKWIL